MLKKKICFALVVSLMLLIVGCKETKTSLADNNTKSLAQENKKTEVNDKQQSTDKKEQEEFNEQEFFEAIKKYLQTSNVGINTKDENNIEDLSIIDSDLTSRDVFLTGERPGVKANKDLEFKFLRYFNQKANVNYYLVNLPYSYTHYLNQYLKTGDDKIIEDLYKELEGTYYWDLTSYNYWKKLYKYNKQLAEDKKIKIVCIDYEYKSVKTISLRRLNDLIPNTNIPEIIKKSKQELQKIVGNTENYDESKVESICRSIQENIKQNENVFKEFLGESFIEFKLLNDNIVFKYDTKEFEGQQEKMEGPKNERRYKNFIEVYNQFPKGKYFGQFYPNQVVQHLHGEHKGIASYMNDEKSPVRNKVLSIIYTYNNCTTMDLSVDKEYGVEELNTIPEVVKDFYDGFKQEYTLFKFNSFDSPFRQVPMGEIYNFQYNILINNSKATEPLNKRY